VAVYMEPRQFKWKFDVKTFMNMVYPWAMLGQTYYLHTQDRRVYFEKGEYDFFNDVPKGFEKVNMFRRWIHEELMGGVRPMGKNSVPTRFTPDEGLVQLTSKTPSA